VITYKTYKLTMKLDHMVMLMKKC